VIFSNKEEFLVWRRAVLMILRYYEKHFADKKPMQD
jgi:hypothetical protein